ncbi:MAG: NAD(P)-dependent oxidoreductase [Lachnospiraceae bacterium]|nr:NAD(P)-dependent oxidoreductase [Lachnospiraceae bacterium]
MKIGFIGLGIMGHPMFLNIARKHDDEVFCTDISTESALKIAEEAQALGAKASAVPGNLELAEKADVIISMVPRSEDSLAVYREILPALGPGKICIDMSTIDPEVSVEIAGFVRETGAEYADAPVVKSQAAAVAGKLGIYVGSTPELFEQIRPILSYMGETILHLGENGRGLVMKICHNALVSQIQNGVNETSELARRNGIDARTYVRAIAAGGGQNAYLDNHVEMLAENEFPAAFTIQNAAKDVHICLDLAARTGLLMPGEENAVKVFDKAMEMGFAKEDWAATVKAYRELAEEGL